jgi:hypothetical protein
MSSARWVAVAVALAVAAPLTAVVVGVRQTGGATSSAVRPSSAPASSSAAPPSFPASADPPVGSNPACSHHVATTGSDRAAGTAAQPWRTIGASLRKVRQGETLCVHGGTYVETVGAAEPPEGRAAAGITLVGLADGGSRPEIRGEFSVVNPDGWTISGFRFTNPSPRASSDQRIVSILGGSDWRFEDNEVTDGPYAGIVIAESTRSGPPRNYVIRNNVVHGTAATNLYLNPSRFSTGGLVEHNLFYDSGTENVKLGWGGTGGCTGTNFQQFGIGAVTFRFNTMDGAQRGALYIAEPGGVHDVDVYGNLLSGQPDYLVRYDSVEGCLGGKVTVHDNAGGRAPRFSQDFGASPVNVSHEHRNVFPIDPQYDARTPTGFHPGNPQAQAFGRYAGG